MPKPTNYVPPLLSSQKEQRGGHNSWDSTDASILRYPDPISGLRRELTEAERANLKERSQKIQAEIAEVEKQREIEEKQRIALGFGSLDSEVNPRDEDFLGFELGSMLDDLFD